MRTCGRCGEEKPLEAFASGRKKRGKYDNMCRSCRSAYGKAHYAANRQRYIDQARMHKQRLALERTRYLIEFFASNPCVDCGEGDPIVLEFDHLRDKSFAIGPELSRRNWQSILDEMEKCEVVCANCHRRRTARRRGALRAVLTQS
jgi:CHAD domain-containing protein